MSTAIKDSQSNVEHGLGVFTHTTAGQGLYNILVRSSLLPGSSLSITIAQSGSTTNSVSSVLPTPSDIQADLQTQFRCAVGDVITITLSSAAIIDQGLRAIKSIISCVRVSS